MSDIFEMRSTTANNYKVIRNDESEWIIGQKCATLQPAQIGNDFSYRAYCTVFAMHWLFEVNTQVIVFVLYLYFLHSFCLVVAEDRRFQTTSGHKSTLPAGEHWFHTSKLLQHSHKNTSLYLADAGKLCCR